MTPKSIRRISTISMVLLGTALLAGVIALSTRARAAAPQVATFPVPGSQVVNPGAQIAFRGVPTSQFGTITVVGSRSGTHTGVVRADSDNEGGSFLPTHPFTAGEQVTVTTSMSIAGATGGKYTFTVATPMGKFPYIPLGKGPRHAGDVYKFRTRPDLKAARTIITRHTRSTDAGDIFLGPQNGPLQVGPMILGPDGRLLYFRSVPKHQLATDVRVQTYEGKPVLTYWQGKLIGGIGQGEGMIYDRSYHQIAAVHAANGLSADLHEFQLTPQGTALITAYYPVQWNDSAVHGPARAPVLDSVVQEIDIKTGLVLFQWDSLDHVPVTDSHVPAPRTTASSFDYFHVNAADPDDDGNIVISGRNTWAAYKVNHFTAQTMWELGGKHSSFTMGRNTTFVFQHDVRIRAQGDRYVTLFDDGAGPPVVHHQSQPLKLRLDLAHKTATEVSRLSHQPHLLSNFEGNVQQLPGNHSFVGWGQQSYFTEYDNHGHIIFDGHFIDIDSNYRAYRFRWVGMPSTRPRVLVATGKKKDTVYVSWNGATQVARWRILGGSSATALHVVSTGRDRSFETALSVAPRKYFEVQGLDGSGKVLGVSSVVSTVKKKK